MESYLATKDGQQYWDANVCIVRLGSGRACYLPPAWFPIATAAQRELTAKICGKPDAAAEPNTNDFPAIVVLTIFSKELWRAVPEASTKAVVHVNSEHCASKSSLQVLDAAQGGSRFISVATRDGQS